MIAEWNEYVRSVGALSESEKVLAAELAQVKSAGAAETGALEEKSKDLESRFNEFERQCQAGVAEARSIAKSAGVGPSAAPAPASVNPQQAIEQLGRIIEDAQREAGLLAGYVRAQQRFARDAADADTRRAALDARQGERERKMAEARERAAAERRRQEVAARIAPPAPEPDASGSKTGLVVLAAVILLAIVIGAIVVVL